MKKLLIAALLFASAFAFAKGYEDWFTPPNKWEGVTAPVKFIVKDESSGLPVIVDTTVGVNKSLDYMVGFIDEATKGLSESAKNAFKVSRLALANSLYASCQAHMNKLKIDNLGAALEGVFVSTYGQYVDEDGNVISKSKSGVDTAKLRQQLLANKNAVVSGGQAAGGSEANPLTLVITQKPYDESQFEQHVTDGRSLTSLRGWYDLADAGTKTDGTDGADGWALDNKDYFIPYSDGKTGNLGWMKWNGWNDNCFSAGDDVTGGSNDKPLRLRGWTAANNCNEHIQNLLTNKTATLDRSRHKILTRYDNGTGATIHWMPFAETVIGGEEGHADDKTIELTYDEGASLDDPKKFRLKGFDAANSAAALNRKDAAIPMADGSENLAWNKPSTLFNESVFGTDSNGKIVLNATVTEAGKTEVMTITQTESSGGVASQTIAGKPLASLADGASLGSVAVSGNEKIGVKNWDNVDAARAGFTVSDRLENGTGYVNDPTRSPAVVVRNGGTLQYAALGVLHPLKIDEDSIVTNLSDGATIAGLASIRGYRNADVGTVPKRTAEGLEWVAAFKVDDASVVTNESGQVALKGFGSAKPEQAANGAVLPFVDATSDDLQWAGIENFFADSVFRKSETTGKMLLNGTSEEGKVKVLAMTGTGGDDQHVAALTFDGVSVDGGNGIVQVHGFDTAPSPFGNGMNFSDALTNTSVSVANMSVPLRVPASGGSGYEVKYAPLAKVTGIPAAAVDNKTIEVNESDPQNKFLQLHGAAGNGITLKEGDVYQIGSDGKGKFAKLGGDADDFEVLTTENASIESYTGDDGGRYFRLRNWMDNREGEPHVLGWNQHDLEYWEARGTGGIEVYGAPANRTLQLTGHNDAAEGAIPYAKQDGNGLDWLDGVDNRIPLLHTDAAPTTMAIGASLDKANVSAVPTLNVANFTSGGNCSVSLNKMLTDPSESSNRSAHQFMARHADNGNLSVHWVGIDDVIAGGSPVDNASITTNYSSGASADGTASIFGFRLASAGDVPHKKSDGKIEWKPVANGGALIVEGTSGSTVTSATCTNKLSFVSASDSNVKFTVTDAGNGNVIVTIGVYYK